MKLHVGISVAALMQTGRDLLRYCKFHQDADRAVAHQDMFAVIKHIADGRTSRQGHVSIPSPERLLPRQALEIESATVTKLALEAQPQSF